tara:strand:+ start:182 stop:409 length:228 start_codon:yes stop_codon:yes gene_type:complete
MVKPKFLIINEVDDTYHIMNSFREIEEYINLQYPENKTSHMSVSRRIKESDNKYYSYYDIIVKELIWVINDLKID